MGASGSQVRAGSTAAVKVQYRPWVSIRSRLVEMAAPYWFEALEISDYRCRVRGSPLFMSKCALLVIDMFNAYQHPDAEQLALSVEGIVEPLSFLVSRTKGRDDVDLIYVNDSHDDFTSGPSAIVQAALQGSRPDLVTPFVPQSGCRFIAKVRHSVFYASPLEYLLRRLGTQRLVLCGQVTEQCILYSALDAYVRHLDIVIPTDAVAHLDLHLGEAALEMMHRNMSAELSTSTKCFD